MAKEEKYPTLKVYIIPVLLFVLNIGMRIINMRYNGLGALEAFNLYESELYVIKIFGNMTVLNNPPLYILFMKFWAALNGINEGWIRLPSVVFISFTSVIVYNIGRRFISFQVGLFSAMAFSACTTGYFLSHEASVYALLTMLATLSMYLYLNVLKNPESKTNNFFLLVVNVLLVYAHFYGITIIITQLFFLMIVTRNQEKVIVAILRSNLILLVLFIPGIYVFFKRVSFIKATGSWLSRPTFDFFYDGFTTASNISLIAIVFLAFLALAYLLFVFKTRTEDSVIRTAWKLIPLWYFIPYVSIFVFSFYLPVFSARNMLFLSPAFYLTVGIALSYAFRKLTVVQYCLMAALTMAMIASVDINPTKKNHIREVERIIKRKKLPETAVVVNPFADFLAYTYYYNRVYFKMCNHTEELMNSEHIYFECSADSIKDITNKAGIQELIYYQTGAKWETMNEKINKVLAAKYSHSDQLYYLKPIAAYRFYN